MSIDDDASVDDLVILTTRGGGDEIPAKVQWFIYFVTGIAIATAIIIAISEVIA